MIQPGNRAPDFRLKDLTGSPISLSELVRNGPVLLAFLKVNCPTCQYTFPFLERLARGSGLTMVGISQNDHKSTVAFCRKYGIEFTVLLDPADERYPASNLYRITNVPSQFLIEPDGMISRSFKGFSRQDLEEIGQRFSFVPFSPHEQIPAFRPG
jgi:peroxiredoxin